ncbi:MAG: type II toxin-antitoxin system prevent-host-death family antitoxin [Caulobacteraceae bacterium]
MTVQFNIAEAKARLSELIARAEAGEEVILARGGKPVATIRPMAAPGGVRRRPGDLAHLGALKDPDYWLEPDPSFQDEAGDDLLS